MKEKNYRISADQLLLMLLGDASERSAVASQVRQQTLQDANEAVGIPVGKVICDGKKFEVAEAR